MCDDCMEHFQPTRAKVKAGATGLFFTHNIADRSIEPDDIESEFYLRQWQHAKNHGGNFFDNLKRGAIRHVGLTHTIRDLHEKEAAYKRVKSNQIVSYDEDDSVPQAKNTGHIYGRVVEGKVEKNEFYQQLGDLFTRAGLTPAEQHIMLLTMQEYNVKEIAAQLGRSPATVTKDRFNARSKLKPFRSEW